MRAWGTSSVSETWEISLADIGTQYPVVLVLEVDEINYMFILDSEATAAAFLNASDSVAFQLIEAFRDAGKNPDDDGIIVHFTPRGRPS